MEGNIAAYDISGHTGFDSAGTDIVCAGITSAVRLTECCITDILGLRANILVDNENAIIKFKLPLKMTGEEKKICQTILQALRLYLKELAAEYPEFIEVLEV